jgi:hypothetical protein
MDVLVMELDKCSVTEPHPQTPAKDLGKVFQ